METSITLLERLCRCPDEEAWRRLDDLYRPLIRRWLLRDLGLEADADDLTQEILGIVFRELGGFRRQRTGSFRAWLRTIAVNQARAHCRKRRPVTQGGDTSDAFAQLADDRSELSRLWDREHNEHVVARLLDLVAEEFSAAHARAFRRHVLDQVPVAAVAAELGMTDNAVLLAKSRILQYLREAGRELLD